MEVITSSYYGNITYIDDTNKNKLLGETIKLSDELTILTKKYESKQWEQLRDKVGSVVQSASVMDQFYLEDYKYQILTSAVLPYMHTMQSRIKLDSRRFHQIKQLLTLLCTRNVSRKGTLQCPEHPAVVLLRVDEIVASINSESGWFESELSSSLRDAAETQWFPILQDYRKGLQRIGEKLFTLGIIEIIRPFVLLYPVWLLLSEAVSISKQIKESEKPDSKSVVQVLKALLMLGATVLQLYLVSLLPGIGYGCLILAVASYIISHCDTLLKPLTPILADNLQKFDRGIDMFASVQKRFFTRISEFIEMSLAAPSESEITHCSSHDDASACITPSIGVEESDTEDIDMVDSDTVDNDDLSILQRNKFGLRKRNSTALNK